MGSIAGDEAGEGGALILLGCATGLVVACGRRRGIRPSVQPTTNSHSTFLSGVRKSKMTAALPLGFASASTMLARTPMTLQAWASCTAQVRFGTAKPI